MSNAAPRPRRTLSEAVHRAHLGVAWMAVALAGLCLTIAGLVALRAYAQNNMQQVARSLAYTVEAAVVFRDAGAAQETLRLIAEQEGVAQARVLDGSGNVLAEWQRPASSTTQALGEQLVKLLGLAPTKVAILRDGLPQGEVEISADGAAMAGFALTGLAVVAVCLALSAVLGLVLSRRMLRDLVQPLQELAQVARAVRRGRAFGQRVLPARIEELRELGDNFNALLTELEARQERLVRQNASLAHQANHDSLTGLPNRSYFQHCLEAAIERARSNDQRIAVLFVDNDHFKRINDTHGHAVGDVLLVTVARRIRDQLRPSDVVARFGGDEFGVLLAPLDNTDEALAIADNILASVAAPLQLENGVSLVPSVSIGVAVFPDHGLTPETLLRRADKAMYRAKTRSRGTQHLAEETGPLNALSVKEIAIDTTFKAPF